MGFLKIHAVFDYKVMATVFYDCEGVLFVDLLLSRRTITAVYNLKVLRKLLAEFAKKFSGEIHRGILFHYFPAYSPHTKVPMQKKDFSYG